MTEQRTLDRLMAHLRTHVAETRRLEFEGAHQTELEERKRLILRLQQQLACAVRDLLTVAGPTPGDPRPLRDRSDCRRVIDDHPDPPRLGDSAERRPRAGLRLRPSGQSNRDP